MSLRQISSMEEMMRIALNGDENVDSLIGYYRDLIDKYNEQRVDWLLNYEQCKDSAADQHIIERETQAADSRIMHLDSKLQQIKANLNAERIKYFGKLEQQKLIKQKLEFNKNKLREMMSVCKPINIPVHKKATHSRPNLHDSRDSRKHEDSSPVQHNSKKTALELELINLTKEHENSKNHIVKKIDLLKAELDELISQHSQRGNECSIEYKQALEKLADNESKLMGLTMEYFKLQMENYEEQRRLQEENQIVRLKNFALAQRLKMMQEENEDEFKSIDGEVKKKNRQFRNKYDKHLTEKTQHLTLLKEQHERINDIYLNKMKRLEEELRDTTSKFSQLEKRTKSETSSLKSQIKILTNRLEKDGVHRMRQELSGNQENRSEESEENESEDTLSMSQLDKINRQVQQLSRKI